MMHGIRLVPYLLRTSGYGNSLAWFDHLDFALVSVCSLGLGAFGVLQRRAGHAGQMFLLFAPAGSSALACRSLDAVSMGDALTFSGADRCP